MKIYRLSAYCQGCPVNQSFWETEEKAKEEIGYRIKNNPAWTSARIDYYINKIEVK